MTTTNTSRRAMNDDPPIYRELTAEAVIRAAIEVYQEAWERAEEAES